MELVVAGSRGRFAQVRRARAGQWTPRAEKRFLAALAATCNVRAACAEAGLGTSSAYNHRYRWPAFFERWKAAEKAGCLRIEAALVEAGCNLFSGGEIEPGPAIEGMTAWHAMQLLRMHRHQVRGTGGRPGAAARETATPAEVARALKRALRTFDARARREEG